jgi:hypothetical protein
MTREEAERIAGPLSRTSKMPCPSYGLPARACITGQKLAKVPGSVCSICYALRGRYGISNVQRALERRLEAITHPLWVEAMVELIRPYEYFRWHDSGDLQGLWHLEKIVEIARRLPGTRFWLPTREIKMVREYLRQNGEFPENLIVRVSAAMVDGPPPSGFPHTCTVSKTQWDCPAYDQGGKCLDCRRCWDPTVENVCYKWH